MKHSDLVSLAAKWLTTKAPNISLKCQYAVTEFVFAGHESPDVFGIRSGQTVLLEVKVSRSDFLADKKKKGRNTANSLGQFRYYVTPSDMIKTEEVGQWGHIEYDGHRFIILKPSVSFDISRVAEMDLMYSILRRLVKPGILFNSKKNLAIPISRSTFNERITKSILLKTNLL